MLDENGQWGTVCAQDWDLEDTRVACRQLELRGAELDDFESFTAAPGSGPIVTGGLQCEGDENRLDDCKQAADWTPESCGPSMHGQDIGVSCNPSEIRYMKIPLSHDIHLLPHFSEMLYISVKERKKKTDELFKYLNYILRKNLTRS